MEFLTPVHISVFHLIDFFHHRPDDLLIPRTNLQRCFNLHEKRTFLGVIVFLRPPPSQPTPTLSHPESTKSRRKEVVINFPLSKVRVACRVVRGGDPSELSIWRRPRGRRRRLRFYEAISWRDERTKIRGCFVSGATFQHRDKISSHQFFLTISAGMAS